MDGEDGPCQRLSKLKETLEEVLEDELPGKEADERLEDELAS